MPVNLRHLTQLSVSNYYGGSTTSLAARPTPTYIRTKYRRIQLAEPSPYKIKTR